jgi:hypothetical protein
LGVVVWPTGVARVAAPPPPPPPRGAGDFDRCELERLTTVKKNGVSKQSFGESL